MGVKYEIYQKTGVREYWIIDPNTESTVVYNIENGLYSGETFEGRVNVPSKILSGCLIDMEKILRYAKT